MGQHHVDLQIVQRQPLEGCPRRGCRWESPPQSLEIHLRRVLKSQGGPPSPSLRSVFCVSAAQAVLLTLRPPGAAVRARCSEGCRPQPFRGGALPQVGERVSSALGPASAPGCWSPGHHPHVVRFPPVGGASPAQHCNPPNPHRARGRTIVVCVAESSVKVVPARLMTVSSSSSAAPVGALPRSTRTEVAVPNQSSGSALVQASGVGQMLVI